MRCEAFMQILPRYPDDMTDAQRQDMRAHAESCAGCGRALADQEEMLRLLHTIDDDLALPEGFSSGWRERLRQEDAPVRKSRMPRWLGLTAAAAAVTFLLGGTALMRGGYLFGDALEEPQTLSGAPDGRLYGDVEDRKASDGAYELYEVNDVAPAGAPLESLAAGTSAFMGGGESAGGGSEAGVPREARVILKNASITLDSERFDSDVEAILALLDRRGGWVETDTRSGEPLSDNPQGGRYAYLRLRVPVDGLDGFLHGMEGIGKVTYRSTTAEDVTESYYDAKGRLDTYIAQRDRLNALLDKAEDMTDIIEIDDKLRQVQYDIEHLQGRLNNWDARAQNAQVDVTVYEVAPLSQTPLRKPFGQRLGDALLGSLRSARAFLTDMAVFAVMALPYLALCAVIVAVGYGVYKGIAHQRRKRREKK